MKASGIVVRVLSDDLNGSHHQRFIVKVSANKEVLVIHNIDIAQRIPNLKAGDKVEFSGHYIWNNQGGMVHWTHIDPHGEHNNGWIKHHGKIYQ